ncbi:hypothetical protein SNUCP3_01410 [Clostridium perfringens A]
MPLVEIENIGNNKLIFILNVFLIKLLTFTKCKCYSTKIKILNVNFKVTYRKNLLNIKQTFSLFTYNFKTN